MFEVKVEGVDLLNKPRQDRRFKNVAGKRNGYKKAYVRCRPGSRSTSPAPGEVRTIGHGTHQDEADLSGNALRSQSRPLAPAQGRPARVVDHARRTAPARATTPAGRPRATSAAAHKQRYRLVDFRRDKDGIPAKVERLEYDPNRTRASGARAVQADGERRYILAPKGVKAGDEIRSGRRCADQAGQCHAAAAHSGGQHGAQHRDEARQGRRRWRAAPAAPRSSPRAKASTRSCACRSGEMRKVHVDCRATIGEVGNDEHNLRVIGKAGAQALARHAPDGARRGDEPGRPPARRRRGQVRPGQPASGVARGACRPRARRRAATSAPTA